MRIEIWGETEWFASRDAYEDLLARSDADRLFLSWDWLTLWWQTLPRRGGEVLRVHVAYEGSTLVGALVTVTGPAVRRGFRVTSAQLAGGRFRESRGAFSEYLDIVAVPSAKAVVRSACIRSVIEEGAASEFVVGVTREPDAWREALRLTVSPLRSYARVADAMTSYQANLSSGFAAYLVSLSSNARRSLFNLRKKLESKGTVQYLDVPAEGCRDCLDQLNELHRLRWNEPAMQGETLQLHRGLIERWAGRGRIRMSQLLLDGRVISVLYDIRVDTIQYNIQMGFDPRVDRSLSIGLLHLGYSMERAAAEGVTTYDFLAGTGRSTDYKRRIASWHCRVATVQFLCDPVLAATYRLYDWISGLSSRRARHEETASEAGNG